MRIVRLRTAVVQANFHWTYVRLYSDAAGGVTGTGECFFAPGLPHILREFEPVLVGEDPRHVERLVEKMRWAASGAGSLGGVVWNAISGIEAALWDLVGKLTGQPIWQLLGGQFRDHVPLYVDCHAAGALECLSPLLQPTPVSWEKQSLDTQLSREQIIETAAERAAEMAGKGYTALKFDLDPPESEFDSATGYPLTGKDIDWMVRFAHAIREAIGPAVDLALDAHWRYRANEMLAVANQIETLRLLWLEDPLPPHDLAGLAHLRRHTSVPIATGENLQRREGFERLIREDLLDIVTPDLQKAGGLAEAKKIADMAHLANKPFSPHMIGSPLAMMASAHVAASVPNAQVIEFHAHDVPFFHELVDLAPDDWFDPGGVSLSDRPGVGLELNDSVGRKYRLPGSAWFDEEG